jgi:hypothetical protein
VRSMERVSLVRSGPAVVLTAACLLLAGAQGVAASGGYTACNTTFGNPQAGVIGSVVGQYEVGARATVEGQANHLA